MNDRRTRYAAFARLLEYPERQTAEERRAILDLAMGGLEDRSDAAAVRGHLDAFATAVHDVDATGMEELYTRTFDINPVVSLEIGWQLYGEAYERGAFLVQMRELLRRHQVPESTELPDHLTHVLGLMEMMDRSEAVPFVETALVPALKKMVAGFETSASPYEHVLRALLHMVENDHLQGVSHV